MADPETLDNCAEDIARIEEFIAEHRTIAEGPSPAKSALARIYTSGAELAQEVAEDLEGYTAESVGIAEKLQRAILNKGVAPYALQRLEKDWTLRSRNIADVHSAMNRLDAFMDHTLTLYNAQSLQHEIEEPEAETQRTPWWRKALFGDPGG